MRTEDLEYLHAVAETKSLNKASLQLNVPYQSINNGIKNLEAEFQTVLIERHPSGSYLTESGKMVEKFSVNLFNDIKVLKSAIANVEAQKNISGNLIISLASPINLSFLPLLNKEFNLLYPQIVLTTITKNDINEIISDLSSSLIDIAFTFVTNDNLNMISALESFSYKIFDKQSLYMVCSSKHPLAPKSNLNMKTALKHPIVLYRTKLYESQFEHILADYAAPKIALVTDNISILMQNIASGKFISFFNAALINSAVLERFKEPNEAQPALTFVPINDAPLIYLCAITLKALPPDKAHLIKLLLKTFSSLV